MPRGAIPADHELGELGLSRGALQGPLSSRSLKEAKSNLGDLKAEARKRFKARAFELHPDRGGDEEAFKRLSHAMDWVETLEIEQRPRPIQQPMAAAYWNSTTSTSTGGSVNVGFNGTVTIHVTVSF